MSLVEPPFEEKDIGTDAVSKKDIVTFLQTHASEKVNGSQEIMIVTILLCDLVAYS